MNTIVQVAAVQMNPKLMQNEKNLEKILLRIQEAAAKGVQLIVFPECALTGHVFRSREEALPFAETISGPATDKTACLILSTIDGRSFTATLPVLTPINQSNDPVWLLC